MKKILLIGLGFLFLGLIFSVSSAHAAATSFSEAYIYWDTVEFSGISVMWLEQGSYSDAYVYAATELGDVDDGDSDWGDGAWTNTGAQASVPGAESNAWTNDTQLGATVSLAPDGINTDFAYGEAGAEYWGELLALEEGFLYFSVDYFISQNLSAPCPDDWAEGWASVGVELFSYNSDENESWLENYVEDGESGYWDNSGTLTVSLWLDEGDEAMFYVWADAEAAAYSEYCEEIPEPAAMMLLGSLATGLFSMASLRKKFKR